MLVMLLSAKLLAEICERLRQPATVGEILAGVLVGPGVLGWIEPTAVTNALAEIGVIFLLFTVGLETKPAAVLRVGKRALIVAVLGVVMPFAGGWLTMWLWDGMNIEALFVGAALVATSVGITARVLAALGLLGAPTSRIILGAAVIDDVLGLIVLACVTSAASGAVNYLTILATAGGAIAFTLFVTFIGAPVTTRLAPRIERLRIGESYFVAGLVLCLGLSVAAAYIGVASLIGAFLAGMMLAETVEDNASVHRQTSGVMEFLVPFFLVSIGLRLDLSVFRESSVILLAFVLTLVAVLTKFLGCGIGALPLGARRAAQVGAGMVPRGEVGIVVAQVGLQMRVIDERLYGVVLFMAVATTLIAPPFLKLLFKSEAAAQGKVDADDAGGIVAGKELHHLG